MGGIGRSGRVIRSGSGNIYTPLVPGELQKLCLRLLDVVLEAFVLLGKDKRSII